MFAPYNHVTGSIAYFTVIANLVMFFMAMCKDPGIDDVIYDHYFKTRYGMKLDEETEDIENLPLTEENTDDTNTETWAKDLTPQQRKNFESSRCIPEHSNEYYLELMDDMNYMPKYFIKKGRKVLFCEKCNIELYMGMEHCIDCQVCISDVDHHCVFFSKCIGGGNVKWFYGAIGALILNFVLVGCFATRDAKY